VDGEARELVRKSMVEYDLGSFEDALSDASKAYENDQRPALLFNIAQCHRALEHWKQAAFFYYGYLRGEPDAKNREAVLALISEMESMEKHPNKGASGPRGPGQIAAMDTAFPCVVPPSALSAWPPGSLPLVNAVDCYQQEVGRLDAEEQQAKSVDPEGICPLSTQLHQAFDRLRQAQDHRRSLNQGTQTAMENLARQYRTEHHGLLEPSNQPSPSPLSAADWQQLAQQFDSAKSGSTWSQDEQANQRSLVDLYREVPKLEQRLPLCRAEAAKIAEGGKKAADEKQRRAEATAQDQQALLAQRRNDPKWMRPVLTATLCWYQQARRATLGEAKAERRRARKSHGIVDVQRMQDLEDQAHREDAAIAAEEKEMLRLRAMSLGCKDKLVRNLLKCWVVQPGPRAVPDHDPLCDDPGLRDYLSLKPPLG
jgi:tetratricopeptide (TPR) repeat protein